MKRNTPDRESDALSFGARPLSAVLALFAMPAWADVTSSGLNTQVSAGPDFAITGGTPAGPNLFQSFGNFSINSSQSATFVNEMGASNIIGRVTGGNVSHIDGKIHSPTPASLYLVNPAGMMFGPNAELDVGGSFHASTAEYVKLGSDQFDSQTTESQAVLMSAAPSAFGFLDAPADIAVKTESDLKFPDLQVPGGKSFSLVGGDIVLGDAGTQKGPEIEAQNGQIRLVAVSGAGEVPTDASQPLAPGLAGGRIEMYDTSLLVPTLDPNAPAGSLLLQAGAIDMTRSALSASTFTSAPGGTIALTANGVTLGDRSKITLNTYSSGDGGSLRIQASNLQLSGGSQISSTTWGSGRGGSIDLQTGATGIHGYASDNQGNVINSGVFANAEPGSSGDGGDITIDTGTLAMSGGAQIAASTFAFSTGSAGHISIQAGDISLTGSSQSPTGDTFPTGIHASLQEGSTGDAGDIDITAHRILLRDGAQIDAASATAQRSGNISLTLTGEDSLLDLDGQSKITALNGNTGESGSIDIRGAHTLRLAGNSGISLETAIGNAGDIHIQADHLLYLLNSYITTSAASGLGNGGNIVIDPIFTVLNNSQIIANALQGNGGNIFITTQFLIQSINSIISASSQFGLQGTVTVNSMDQNIAQSIAALPSNLLDAGNLLQEDCASHTSGSTFTTAGRGRLPASPDDDLDITFLPSQSGDCGI